MMIVTFPRPKKSGPAVRLVGPLRGFRGIRIFESARAKGSVLAALEDALKRSKKETEFLFLSPGSSANRRLRSLLDGSPSRTFDVAAYVERIGTPTKPGPFDGIGWIDMKTVFFRTSLPACRVLIRWKEWVEVHGKPDREALLLALSEIKDASFLHLPPEYCWIETSMRSFHPAAEPVIEHHPDHSLASRQGPPAAVKVALVKKKESSIGLRPPEVVWSGHLYDYSGYGKMNRETIFRVANTLNVRLDTTHQEPVTVDEYLRHRLDAMKETLVGPKAPLLRVFGPDFQADRNRYRICWTMMESYKTHPQMVKLMNDGFNEVWAPTEWNRQVFVDSGVRVKTRAFGLGVNTLVYKIRPRQKMPSCRLLSTAQAGLVASPDGFIFLSLGLPSFRKGFDVIADAMEQLFKEKPDVHFVIALTHSLPDWNQKVYQQFAKYKSRIWALEGRFDEHALSKVYSAADCYVSASRGEGWNLPVCEAAACGLPVICPDNTSHPEVVGKDAFVFATEKPARCPEVEQVSGWYGGMPFSVLGKKSVKALAEMMELVHSGDQVVRLKAAALHVRMLTDFSWDKTAEMIAYRLLEVQS